MARILQYALISLIILLSVVLGVPFGLYQVAKYPWYRVLNSVPQHSDLKLIETEILPFGLPFDEAPGVHQIYKKGSSVQGSLSRIALTDFYIKGLQGNGWEARRSNSIDKSGVKASKTFNMKNPSKSVDKYGLDIYIHCELDPDTNYTYQQVRAASQNMHDDLCSKPPYTVLGVRIVIH